MGVAHRGGFVLGAGTKSSTGIGHVLAPHLMDWFRYRRRHSMMVPAAANRIGIGAGNVGGTLRRMWAAKGHEIAFGVRRPNDANVQAVVTGTGNRTRAVSKARSRRGRRRRARHPVERGRGRPQGNWRSPRHGGRRRDESAQVRSLRPRDRALDVGRRRGPVPRARVVKAFNTIGAAHMADPRFGAQRASMFICGDDSQPGS